MTLGRQEFEKEGNLRTFVLRVKDDDGSVRERTYKFNPPLVHRVLPRAKSRRRPGIAREPGPAAKKNLNIKGRGIQRALFTLKDGMAEKVKELHLERD